MQLTFMLTSINNVYVYRSRNEYLLLLGRHIPRKILIPWILILDFIFLIILSGKRYGRGRVGVCPAQNSTFWIAREFSILRTEKFLCHQTHLLMFTLFSNFEMSHKLNWWMSDLQMCFIRWKLIELHISNCLAANFHLWKLPTRVCLVSEVP